VLHKYSGCQPNSQWFPLLYHGFTWVSSGAEELFDSRVEKQMFLLHNRLVLSESTQGSKHTTIWQGTRQSLGEYIRGGNTGVGHQWSGRQEWLGQVMGIKQSGEAGEGDGNKTIRRGWGRWREWSIRRGWGRWREWSIRRVWGRWRELSSRRGWGRWREWSIRRGWGQVTGIKQSGVAGAGDGNESIKSGWGRRREWNNQEWLGKVTGMKQSRVAGEGDGNETIRSGWERWREWSITGETENKINRVLHRCTQDGSCPWRHWGHILLLSQIWSIVPAAEYDHLIQDDSCVSRWERLTIKNRVPHYHTPRRPSYNPDVGRENKQLSIKAADWSVSKDSFIQRCVAAFQCRWLES